MRCSKKKESRESVMLSLPDPEAIKTGTTFFVFHANLIERIPLAKQLNPDSFLPASASGNFYEHRLSDRIYFFRIV